MCGIIIIIIASWEFPLMSNAPILNVFHILQLWTCHGFFIVISHSGRSCAFLANVLTSSPPQSEMSSTMFLTVSLVHVSLPSNLELLLSASLNCPFFGYGQIVLIFVLLYCVFFNSQFSPYVFISFFRRPTYS